MLWHKKNMKYLRFCTISTFVTLIMWLPYAKDQIFMLQLKHKMHFAAQIMLYNLVQSMPAQAVFKTILRDSKIMQMFTNYSACD